VNLEDILLASSRERVIENERSDRAELKPPGEKNGKRDSQGEVTARAEGNARGRRWSGQRGSEDSVKTDIEGDEVKFEEHQKLEGLASDVLDPNGKVVKKGKA